MYGDIQDAAIITLPAQDVIIKSGGFPGGGEDEEVSVILNRNTFPDCNRLGKYCIELPTTGGFYGAD